MYKQFYSKLLLLVAMIVAGAGTAWADTVTFTAGTDTSEETSITKDGITITFSEGVFNRTDNYRCYSGASMTISSTVGNMTQIDFTATSSNPMTKFSGNPDVGSWTDSNKTQWTGNASEINFGTTSGQARITKIVVTYTPAGSNPEPSCATPIFSPLAGTYYEAQSITINCDTEGSTIYYTLDGTDPTNQSTKYTGAITVNETTTIKAIAYDATGAKSAIASATYTIVISDELWKLTDISKLTPNDVFVIVGNNGDNYAMSNDNAASNPPSAVKVTVDGEVITSAVPDKLKWTISGDATNGYTFYPEGSTETWLYCTNTNNGVRVGVNDNKVFKINSNYLYNTGTDPGRYVGIYNSQDWRCYTTINSNISNQTLAFYKKVTNSDKAAAEISFEETSYEVNLGESFTAPELTNPNQLEVTYASSNTDVATVNETSGEVTIVAAGQTTITATFAGNDEYEAGTASYTLTVVDPNAPGTANNPYTVEAAIAYINTLGTSSSPTEVYVKGIVSQVDSYNERYSSITYWISDDGETTTQMEVYSGKGLNSADFASIDDIQVGDEVTVCGTVKLYNQTPEFDYNNYLVSFNRPVVPEVKYYLAGSWDGETSWGADGMLEMTKNDDGTYSVSKEFTAEYTEFKIYKKDVDESETWYGGATNDENPYRIHRDWNTAPLSGENTAKNFIINEAGNYTFTVDVDALTLTVTGFPAQEFFLAGSFNNWATDATQFEIGTTENVYTLTQELEAGAEFKVVSENSWYGSNETISAENCTSIALSTDGGNMTIATAGTYIFTLTKTQNGLFLTIDGFPEPVVKYFLAGSWENGWTAEGMVELNEQVDGSFINTINDFEANTEFKIVKDVNGAKTWYGGIPLEEGGEFAFINKDWCTDIVLKNDTEVDGSYKNFKIEKAGDYTFKVTDEGEDGLFLDVAGWVVNYALVTDASQLEAGKDIILVGENNGAFYALGEQKTNNRGAVAVTKKKGIIAVNHSGSIPFITLDCIEGEAGTLWGFDTDDGYLYAASSSSNHLKTLRPTQSFTSDANAQATIKIAEDGQATIVFQGTNSHNDLRFNNDNSNNLLFSCYTSDKTYPHAYIYMETELEEIPLEVTITEAEWATYVAEDDVTFPEGVTAYVPTTISTTSVGLTQVTQAMKGEAVIVNGAEGTYQLAYAEAAISEKNAGNQFVISDGTVSDGSQYVLSNKNQGIVGFYKVKAGVTIPTGKPYLVIENAAKDFVPFGGGEATGIETIDNEQLTIGEAYDLQGRKVQKLSKGIFIQNGRKVVVK